MPTDELAAFMEQMLGGIVERVSVEAEIAAFNARMKQRDARRLREGWTPDQVRRGTRAVRPSDGKPTGSAFDYDEYVTRKADRQAADPESVQREKRAKREANRAWWHRFKETGDFDHCNEELKELRLETEKLGSNRLTDIWAAIIQSEQAAKIEAIHLDQASRIANIKNRERVEGRIRGLGAAAKAAGY